MKRVVRVGVAHHLLERHQFCDSPINIVVCRSACQFAALVTVRQPIFNRPSTATSTILQPPSNHHSSAPRPSLLPSAATRTDILIPPPTRRDTSCNQAQTTKRRAGRCPPAQVCPRNARRRGLLYDQPDRHAARLRIDFGVDVREAEAELGVVFARLLRRVLQRDDGRASRHGAERRGIRRASSTDLRAGKVKKVSMD